MLQGKCPKCGARYFGWALRYARHLKCDKSGVDLKITGNEIIKVKHKPRTGCKRGEY